MGSPSTPSWAGQIPFLVSLEFVSLAWSARAAVTIPIDWMASATGPHSSGDPRLWMEAAWPAETQVATLVLSESPPGSFFSFPPSSTEEQLAPQHCVTHCVMVRFIIELPLPMGTRSKDPSGCLTLDSVEPGTRYAFSCTHTPLHLQGECCSFSGVSPNCQRHCCCALGASVRSVRLHHKGLGAEPGAPMTETAAK